MRLTRSMEPMQGPAQRALMLYPRMTPGMTREEKDEYCQQLSKLADTAMREQDAKRQAETERQSAAYEAMSPAERQEQWQRDADRHRAESRRRDDYQGYTPDPYDD